MEVAELPGTITVRGPEPVIAHMASYRAWAEQHDVPFDRARTLVADGIARSGAYEITCLGGIPSAAGDISPVAARVRRAGVLPP
ncbi:hypothetical protein ACFWWA_17285 [Streptomyces goshikiensis]|uniref:hypothetical protein n=1 Tax=Streptomyces goshikiensis TaxID=1942 RepID=UPI0036575069